MDHELIFMGGWGGRVSNPIPSLDGTMGEVSMSATAWVGLFAIVIGLSSIVVNTQTLRSIRKEVTWHKHR